VEETDMTASLTTTGALLDFLPFGEAPAGRRTPAKPQPLDAVPTVTDAGVPLRHRLLPMAIRRRLAERAARRALAASLARLHETSPHLLDDIGLLDWSGTAPARAEVFTSWPEPTPPAVRGASWSYTSAMPRGPEGRHDERASTLTWRIERPVWNAPDHWLR